LNDRAINHISVTITNDQYQEKNNTEEVVHDVLRSLSKINDQTDNSNHIDFFQDESGTKLKSLNSIFQSISQQKK